MAKGKSMKLGGGGRFAKLEAEAAASGARNPGAVAAAAGRKKYGAKKMAEMAAAGHKSAAHQKAGNTDYRVTKRSPSSNNEDLVKDTIEGMGETRDTKEGTAEDVLATDSKYAEVPGSGKSQVKVTKVTSGKGRIPSGY